MEQYLPLILSAVGGTVLGPIVSKLTGGSGTGGIIGGILGGIGAHYGLDAANVQVLGDAAAGATSPMNIINSLLEGGVGGGVVGVVAGLLMKSKGQRFRNLNRISNHLAVRPEPDRLFYSAVAGRAPRFSRTPRMNGTMASRVSRAASRKAAPPNSKGALSRVK